jgi:hypothetical protein
MKKVTKNNKPSNTPVDKVKTREYTDSAEYSKAKKSYNDSLAVAKGPSESYKRTKEVDNLIAQGNFKKAKVLLDNYSKNPTEGQKAFERLKKLNKKEPKPIKGYNYGWGLAPNSSASPVYKKPVELPTYKSVKKELVKPVPQKPEVKKPEVKKPSGVTEFKQGRKFMTETGLKPGFYTKDELANNPNKKIPIKRR